MAFIPNIDLLSRHKGKILVYAVVFWLTIGALVFAAEAIAHFALGTPYLDAFDQKQYIVRWSLWLLFTPVLILLGLKINIRDYRIIPFVILHIVLGTLVLSLDFSIEVFLLRSSAERFYARPVFVAEFLQPFLHKYFAYIINYFLIIGIVNIYVYMARLQQTQKNLHDAELQNNELKYQLTLSRLKALRMQVHPHFLFNTHHSVIGLIIKNEGDKAVEMLTRLSSMLRLTLEEQSSEFVTLAAELEIIDLYLDVQKVRFRERFQYTRNVSSEALSFRLPYLLLQPLIENAVIYGVEVTDEHAYIIINAVVKDELLHIEIINNYCPHEADSRRNGMGIGIANVKERLQKYYGQKAEFSFVKEQGSATVVSLKIPVYEQ